MSRWKSRWSTQLGVAEKRVNGRRVGYVLGFIDGDTWIRALRKNLIFPTKEAAIATMESIDRNSERKDTEFKMIEKGIERQDWYT